MNYLKLPASEQLAACLQVLAKEEARLGGLVVSYILVDDGEAIDGVLKEGMKTILGWKRRDVETQMLIVTCANKHLLAPVTDDVGLQTRIALGTVIKLAALKANQGDGLLLLPVKL